MSNRIGGDFSAETMEAFRAAYAAQLNTPQDQDVDDLTGLPTNTVSNTSPWIEHTGLWKYPSGRGPDEDLQRPFDPEAYISKELESEEEDPGEELSDEEVENLLNEILDSEEEVETTEEEIEEEPG